MSKTLVATWSKTLVATWSKTLVATWSKLARRQAVMLNGAVAGNHAPRRVGA